MMIDGWGCFSHRIVPPRGMGLTRIKSGKETLVNRGKLLCLLCPYSYFLLNQVCDRQGATQNATAGGETLRGAGTAIRGAPA